MPLRPAEKTDLLPASILAAAAFYDDNLFGDKIHPHRHQYPDDMHIYWLKRFRASFSTKDQYFLVMTDGPDDAVAGIAHWIRIRAQQSDEVAPPANQVEGDGLPMNRAADPEMEDVIERSEGFLAHQWTGQRAESWYLACLAVDPTHHGKGYGRQLVAWGLEKAEMERICASVISAYGKDNFYKRCGFDTESGYATDGEGNPLSGVKGGLILFRDAL